MSGDDWSYYGSYMTSSRAHAEYDRVIKSYGYDDDNRRPPITVDIDGEPLLNVSIHFDVLASDYSLILNEVFKEILNREGLEKFNEIFNCSFLSIDQASLGFDTLLDAQNKNREVCEFEKLSNDPNVIHAIDLTDIIFRSGDSSNYIEYGWINYSGLYVPIKGRVKHIIGTVKEKKLVDGKFVEYEFSRPAEIYLIKPEKPFDRKSYFESNEYSTNTWLEKYNKEGRLQEKLYYGGTGFIDENTIFKNGYKDIFTDTGFVSERKIYGRLGDTWPTCKGTMDVPPDRKIILSYELDKSGNPKVIFMKEMKSADLLIRSSVITIEIGFE